MKIRSVCIVGGGSSGWMTAALLAKNLKNTIITVVEPKDVPTIGVGESTLGHINRYLHAIGLEGKDKEWMPKCDATYKVSIQFTDFKNIGTRFQYPFGQHDFSGNKTPFDWYKFRHHEEFDTSYAEYYNPITYLADANRMTNSREVITNFDFNDDTAYHFDATKFGEYLKNEICIPNGVRVIRDKISKVYKKEDGSIDWLQLSLSPTMRLSADLYIDCTGFKSLLLEEEMGSKFISFNDILLNDTALAARIPYVDREKEIHNVTDCHALQYGWVWDIPLWNRIGTGYCFSQKFTTVEAAEKEFRKHLSKKDKKRAEEAEFFKIDIRHGKRERGWVKNCVGIGLSYGFLEPLESTGLLTTHENALRLLDTLQRREGFISKADIDGYNLSADKDIEEMKDFIAMHYVLSQRDDSSYWKHCTEKVEVIKDTELFDQVMRAPRLYQEFVYSVTRFHELGPLDGLLYIAAGMGYNPMSETQYKFATRVKDITATLQESSVLTDHLAYHKKAKEYVSNLPTTFEFLRDHVYSSEKEKVVC